MLLNPRLRHWVFRYRPPTSCRWRLCRVRCVRAARGRECLRSSYLTVTLSPAATRDASAPHLATLSPGSFKWSRPSLVIRPRH